MPPRRVGTAISQQRHRSSRGRMCVIVLLAVSVIAPLIFLAGRASRFSSALGRNDFLEWQSTINNLDSLKNLRGIEQIQSLLPEEVLSVFSSKDEDNGQLNLNIVGGKDLSSLLVKEQVLDISRQNYTQRNVSTKDYKATDMQQQQGLRTDESANKGSRGQNPAEGGKLLQIKQAGVSSPESHEIIFQQNDNTTGDDQLNLLTLPSAENISQDHVQMIGMKVDAGANPLVSTNSSTAKNAVTKPQVARQARNVSARQTRKEKKASKAGNAVPRQVRLSTGVQYLPSKQQKNESPDSQVKSMRDLLIKAKAYAAIAQAHHDGKLLRDLRFVIKDCQDALGDATTDTQLPGSVPERVKLMEYIMAKADDQLYDCTEMVEKMKLLLHMEEETSRSLRKESLFLSQLAAKTIPKGLHCLSMRLTVEYYLLASHEHKLPNQGNLEDPTLYHYALFSDNVLAAGVVVNSTVFHAMDPEKHVFHVVTDRLNYGAMNMWFLKNPPGKATIHIENVDSFTWLNSSYSPVLRQLESAAMREYYFKANQPEHLAPGLKFRNPKYLSMLNHLRFYLPHIYPKLDKILFLDDDIVVQKDLTPLWSIDMRGKVNGAVETCGASFHRFDKYLNFSNPLISKQFDPNACGWAYGMNVFDLQQWKKMDITGIYHKWQEKNEDRMLWRLGTLPAGLLTFYNLTFSLEKHWHVLGLGYSALVSSKEIENAAVIHYNGNMKPWLEIGMEKYKHYWRRYVKLDEPFLQQCNVNL
ncbi:hypothetical protein O6H91_22G067500 [Diphasiastrum complanatum]|uniref:Uncharacterized protein n=2 Tax=Diphasiastrum complanatum TaxID=34168 RepID=A0ACC2AGJ8_DIPCM|nr:hypothetical protein O6H91_Y002800 [Diphasiastrum complanatum]KAJ7298350.1 hypothetical protein O6H91_Y002800 [Diphasiastrum complanatum]KAJ7516686.1 hypothetical protein O6H91_22G067500 [Diphasiastrum complanatum]KAJ7516689.1 hypothetical protein O6H91_22G067500 [Diphasiastrum complanatum]